MTDDKREDYERVTTGCLAIATTKGIRIVSTDGKDITMDLQKWSDLK